MFRFMSMASAMLPNMELDVGVFRLKIDDEGVFFEIRYPDDFRKKLRRDSGVSGKMNSWRSSSQYLKAVKSQT